MNGNDIVCFYNSSTQKSLQEKIAIRIRKKYIPIKVRVNGSNWVEATDMILESEKNNYITRFSDAKLISKGKLSEMVYKKGGLE